MNTEFDDVEQALGRMRPARLPAQARQGILREMDRPAAGHGAKFWLWHHRVGLGVALAGALSLAAMTGLYRLSLERAASRDEESAMAAANEQPLATLEARLIAASQKGENTLAVLCSPSILTNFQNGY